MSKMDMNQILQTVREQYGRAATTAGGCGSDPASTGCCGKAQGNQAAGLAMGYTTEQLQGLGEDANLGLGCGNPNAFSQLKQGDVVLDLGSGGGFDCFIAARAVGESGRVIGVDMTPEMIQLARQNAGKMKTANVEFRKGEIEHLPVDDESVDAIISNCAINLSPDKQAVFREAYRVLKPAGRLAVSDVVATAPLPQHLRDDASKLTGCIAGALTVDELEAILAMAGFEQIRVLLEPGSRRLIEHSLPQSGVEQYIVSARIEAVKPSSTTNPTKEAADETAL
ncbi:MAG: arsenite S-adenosylmethyltransferase [Deltaproteobacteria bacterium SG8_13]|nr:MAG: arsenite S-adenosylmethyltransferase [Deltaproteobacteria bacterium SG8_13]